MDKEEKNIEEIEEEKEEQDELDELDEEEFTYTIDNNNVNNDYKKNYEKNSSIYMLVGFIILLIIIITLVVVVNKKEKKAAGYTDVETKLVNAAKKYYEKYPEQLPQMSVPTSIDAEKLIENSYLKPFSEMVDENTQCTGHVKIYKNDDNYAYFPYLNCGTNYKSTKLKDKIIEENLVTEGSGLYKKDNEYIFRGEYPNNYVKFNNDIWRIVKINDDGSIKLLSMNKKPEKIAWDDRYNNERNGNTGKNDFRVSRMLEELTNAYKENKYVSKENKELLIKRNWCIGKTSQEDTPISNLTLCNDVYEDLYIGLLTIDEILIPSLDENCKNIFDGECTNYNYFTEINVGWTLTTGIEKTYTVFSGNQGAVAIRNASVTNNVRPVININPDTLYKSGDGTEKTPYIIEK